MAKEWCHSNPSNDFGPRLLSERKINRQYNAPTVSEVAALIINDFGDGEPLRDIIVNKTNSGPQRISELHPSYMALQYPLLFPYGEDGFHEKVPYHTNTGEWKTKRGNSVEIDDIISAELPSPIDVPESYKVVTEYVLHVETVIDEDGYALYRQSNNKVNAKKGKFVYDNKHVVPHNRATVVIQENVKGGQNRITEQIMEVDEIKNF
ncbi:hypothetical protein Tco_0452329 [Tanacetum coccineum]